MFGSKSKGGCRGCLDTHPPPENLNCLSLHVQSKIAENVPRNPSPLIKFNYPLDPLPGKKFWNRAYLSLLYFHPLQFFVYSNKHVYIERIVYIWSSKPFLARGFASNLSNGCADVFIHQSHFSWLFLQSSEKNLEYFGFFSVVYLGYIKRWIIVDSYVHVIQLVFFFICQKGPKSCNCFNHTHDGN